MICSKKKEENCPSPKSKRPNKITIEKKPKRVIKTTSLADPIPFTTKTIRTSFLFPFLTPILPKDEIFSQQSISCENETSLRFPQSSYLMATPNQEAIDTFMSITGASDAVAVQKLEVIRFTHLDICFFLLPS